MKRERMNTGGRNKLTGKGLQLAKKLIIIQLVISFLCSLVFLFVYGLSGAATALVGGMISVIPNFVFTRYAFRHAGARAVRDVVRSFYAGEAIKMVLTILLFAIAFVTLEGPWPPLFISFGVVTFTYWLIPFINLKQH